MTKSPQNPAAEPEEIQSAVEETDYKLLWQRVLADQENGRRRLEQDKEQFARFALEGFISELLPVVDNFYRATDHIPQEQQSEGWVAGVLYIQKQLLDALEKRGVSEIPAKEGGAFDPNQHEAIGTEASDTVPEDHIIAIKNKGYMLHDRVLRPTQVIVSKK